MTLTLKGYDLFSIGQFQAALQEALLPATLERAGLAPAILASIQSLELGEAHEAVAAALLKDALNRASATSALGVATPVPVQLAQAQQFLCDEEAGIGGDCSILINPEIPPKERIDTRGVEGYSG
jgi:hypothetical protein